MKAQGDYADFTRWRVTVGALIRGNDAEIYDFSENNPYYHDDTWIGAESGVLLTCL